MEFINTVDVLGDNAVTDSFIEGTITELRDEYITIIGSSAFVDLKSLTLVDFPNLSRIKGAGFWSTVKLDAIILRNPNVVCILESAGAFYWSSLYNGTGYVYCPAARLAEYQQATNWSTYAAQFRALEDYTVDGTIWGDLDENKI
jgi:hypothetical protein